MGVVGLILSTICIIYFIALILDNKDKTLYKVLILAFLFEVLGMIGIIIAFIIFGNNANCWANIIIGYIGFMVISIILMILKIINNEN